MHRKWSEPCQDAMEGSIAQWLLIFPAYPPPPQSHSCSQLNLSVIICWIDGYKKEVLHPKLLKIMLFFESCRCLTNLLWFLFPLAHNAEHSSYICQSLPLAPKMCAFIISQLMNKSSVVAGETWTQKEKGYSFHGNESIYMRIDHYVFGVKSVSSEWFLEFCSSSFL